MKSLTLVHSDHIVRFKKALRSYTFKKTACLLVLSLLGSAPHLLVAQATDKTIITTIEDAYIERSLKDCLSANCDDPDDDVTDILVCNVSKGQIQFEDVLAFELPGFSNFVRENKKLLQNVTLLVEGIELDGIKAFVESGTSDVVRFRFSKNSINYELRKRLYKLPGQSLKKVTLGVRIDDSTVIYYNEPACIFLKHLDNSDTYIVISLIVLIGCYLVLIYFTSALRDNPGELNDQRLITDEVNIFVSRVACYSFSRSQLAFWMLIIIGCFCYIWLLTGDLQSVNNTALILLGITTATITTSGLINVSEKAKAETILNENGDNSQLKKFADFKTRNSHEGNFFLDILSDNNGISIHRLQALLFNIIFGIVFVYSVSTDYSMPEFDETQLILLGLSNGTYTFLKTTENRD